LHSCPNASLFLYAITGIIANLKAHFRYHQYFRAANKHIAGVDLDHAEEYRMDEVDALFFLADSWLKIEPQTIKNCWDHTKILDFKFADRERIETEEAIPNFELPLSDALVRRFNEIIPDLPGNRDDNGNPLVTELDGLDLAANESDLIVFQPELVEFHEDNDGEDREEPVVVEEKEDESEEEVVDVKEIREKLKQSYETILYYSLPMDDQDRSMLKTIRKKLDEIRSEEVGEKKQTTLRNYFSAI